MPGRRGDAARTWPTAWCGSRSVEDAGEPALRLVREATARPHAGRHASRPASANPLLLYFLETTVRAMAEATGGSPYYIRNRIREALVAADLGAVRRRGGAAR